MSAQMVPLVLFVATGCLAFLTHLYWKSPGYLARVERTRAENAIAVETKRWEARKAQQEIERRWAAADPEPAPEPAAAAQPEPVRTPDVWGVA